MSRNRENKNTHVQLFIDLPDVMEVKDIMSVLKISRHAVYSLISSKKLNSFKIGRSYKISKDELNKYIRLMNSQDEP